MTIKKESKPNPTDPKKGSRSGSFPVIGLLFLVIIFLPLLNQVFDFVPSFKVDEKRKLARRPQFKLDSIFQFTGQYSRYYRDHFTFRGLSIYLNNLSKVKLFATSPIPRVLPGKDNWLFIAWQRKGLNWIDYFRSTSLFTNRELEQWKAVLEKRRDWLAARGIGYIFVIAPNKNTIYPEFMPDHIRKVNKVSRMDQLLEFLKKNASVSILDLRPALRAAKKNHPVYSSTDTHWNDYGAYIAYNEIMGHLSSYFPNAVPLPLSRFDVVTRNRSGGDLAITLSLEKTVFRENMVRLNASPPLTHSVRKLKRLTRFIRQNVSENKSAPLPNILMVHDSFYKKLRPYLSESFSRIFYIWDWDYNFYTEIIEKEKPALLIDEMAERFLLEKIPGCGKIRR